MPQSGGERRQVRLLGQPGQLAAAGVVGQQRHRHAERHLAPPVRADVAEVERLINTKFDEMRDTLEAYRTHGRAAALELMRTDFGVLTMRRIDDRVRNIQKAETASILQASES